MSIEDPPSNPWYGLILNVTTQRQQQQQQQQQPQQQPQPQQQQQPQQHPLFHCSYKWIKIN